MADEDSLRSGSLAVEPVLPTPDGSLVLVWKGRSTGRDPSRAILPFATVWLEKALHRQTPLRLHFERLEYMNSSTVVAIIEIIREARLRGVRLVIRYDDSKSWQKLGFDALRVFATSDGLFELSVFRESDVV
jgi:hypothetical protein